MDWALCALNMCLTVTTDVGESVVRSACVKTLALVLGSNLNVVPVAWSSHTLTDMFVDMKYSAVASSRRWHVDALRRLLWHLAACVWNIDWDVGCKEQVSGIRTGAGGWTGFYTERFTRSPWLKTVTQQFRDISFIPEKEAAGGLCHKN